MAKKLLSISETAQLLGVSIDTLRRWDKEKILLSFRPSNATKRYYQQEDIDHFLRRNRKSNTTNDLVNLGKKWVLSPRPMTIDDNLYCQTSDIFYARLQHFELQISKEPKLQNLSSLIIGIIGEIGNNSYNHNLGNWPDIPGIFFGHDLEQREIILADRGQGVYKTLKRVLPNLKDDQTALVTAFTKYISGRAPEDRGNGLKFVKDVVCNNPIHLEFYTGKAKIIIKQNDSELKAEKTNKNFHGCLAIINF